jgi:prepilin-type processing-associated H-X9-DG protein
MFTAPTAFSPRPVRENGGVKLWPKGLAFSPRLWQVGRRLYGPVAGCPWSGETNGIILMGSTPDGTKRRGTCALNCTNDHEVYSFHLGGANAVFADGSMHFLKAGMDIRILARLMTRAGGEVVEVP